MLIIEGPDGSGKTTLIERLGFQRRHLKALRSGVGSEDAGNWGGDHEAIHAYALKIREAWAALLAGTRVAYDRFHISETIYGPLLRGASAIKPEEVKILNRMLRGKGIDVILCLPSFETTYANVTREGRERPAYQTDDFLTKSYAGFTKATGLVTHVWDYTRDNLPVLGTWSKLQCAGSSIGSPNARVLIVGEPTSDLLPWPIFGWAGRPSAETNAALWYAGLAEDDMAFVASGEVNEAVTSRTQLVVSLDDGAHKACANAGLIHGIGARYASVRNLPLGTMAAKLLELRSSLR